MTHSKFDLPSTFHSMNIEGRAYSADVYVRLLLQIDNEDLQQSWNY